MSVIAGLILAFALLIAIAFAVVQHRLAAGSQLPVTAAWIDELSAERYRPMLRLLDARDLEMLRAQPGVTPATIAALRAERCRIFRQYLASLSADFSRVCSAVKVFMIESRHDRPDLASALLRAEVLFALALLAVSFRLALYRWGIGSVDVRWLIALFEGMRLELRVLVPSPQPAA